MKKNVPFSYESYQCDWKSTDYAMWLYEVAFCCKQNSKQKNIMYVSIVKRTEIKKDHNIHIQLIITFYS